MSKLYQCPYDKATKCSLEEGCLGCETFGEYLNNKNSIKDCLKETIQGLVDSEIDTSFSKEQLEKLGIKKPLN